MILLPSGKKTVKHIFSKLNMKLSSETDIRYSQNKQKHIHSIAFIRKYTTTTNKWTFKCHFIALLLLLVWGHFRLIGLDSQFFVHSFVRVFLFFFCVCLFWLSSSVNRRRSLVSLAINYYYYYFIHLPILLSELLISWSIYHLHQHLFHLTFSIQNLSVVMIFFLLSFGFVFVYFGNIVITVFSRLCVYFRAFIKPHTVDERGNGQILEFSFSVCLKWKLLLSLKHTFHIIFLMFRAFRITKKRPNFVCLLFFFLL